MRLLDQLISLLGAILILAAYLSLQRGWIRREDRGFNAVNLVGSVLLTYSAVKNWNVGFIVLEGSWALLSIPGTLKPRRVPRK
jgi:hypothetical protein